MAHHAPSRVLVTGGAGFIGCNFVRRLIATDPAVRVVNLDALTYAGDPRALDGLSDPSRHLLVHGDICDAAPVRALFEEHDFDTVVHFAAESHVDRSISGPRAFVDTNIVGTFTLLEAARVAWGEQKSSGKSRRFHHVSTDEVFGSLSPTDPPFNELTPYSPRSPYSASKASSDHLVRAYQHTYALPVTLTNCSNNYGPYQHGEKFIPTVIRACLAQAPIPVYGSGTNVRDWLFVLDHCEAIERVVREGRDGETYVIGGLNEWANLDVAREICKIMDDIVPANAPHARLVTFVEDRKGHDFRYAIDATKMRTELGWAPRETFEAGLRRTVAWYVARASTAGR